MKTIIVTGSVGSGKTTISKKLAKKLNLKYTDVNKLITKNKLSSGYDKKRKCKIIEIKKLNKFLINMIKNSKENLIIDSHLSHYLPRKYVDLCIVTKCDIKTIEKRLKKRKYDKNKIKENIECEIFNNCLIEAKQKKHKVFVINTTKSININQIAPKVKRKLK